MDWGHLFISIFKSIFVCIPIFICYIAVKIKWTEWREGR
jgi:hypothetical protein